MSNKIISGDFNCFQFKNYKDLKRKNNFFESCSWFKFDNLRLTQKMPMKFYTSEEKVVKPKVRKFWGLFATFVVVPGENW